MLRRLIYTSRETLPLTQAQLVRIVDGSAQRNRRDGLTSLVFHHGSQLFQGLEGDPALVYATFQRIAADRRHHEVTVLYSEPCERRVFSDAMAYVPACPATSWAVGRYRTPRGLFVPEALTPLQAIDLMVDLVECTTAASA